MEDSGPTQYVSFLDDHRTRDENNRHSPRGSTSPSSIQNGVDGPIGSTVSNNDALSSSSIMRKLIQSHRYKSRVAALVGLFSVFLFSVVFLLFHFSKSSDFGQHTADGFGGAGMSVKSSDKPNDIGVGDGSMNGWFFPSNDMYSRRELTDISRANGHSKILDKDDKVWDWTDQQFEGAFHMWKTYFEKKYEGDEETLHRYSIFRKNMMYIATHNDLKSSYTLAMNEFGDLTSDEFKARYLGLDTSYPPSSLRSSADAPNELSNEDEKASIPDSTDWRKKGCVSPVKDQGLCGSCWAFSSTGSIEGAMCAKKHKKVSLSEQQLVDCDKKDNGCGGGLMRNAFLYVKKNGLCTEEDYPYDARVGLCKRDACPSVVTVTGYHEVSPQNEGEMQKAVAFQGPVSVAIEADQPPFQFYHSGVFDGTCGNKLDHGVLVVGYGTDDETGKPYWIVKNSWGPRWGEHGYIRLARYVNNPNGQCGILAMPIYPIVDETSPITKVELAPTQKILRSETSVATMATDWMATDLRA